jgi:hypothetical protein
MSWYIVDVESDNQSPAVGSLVCFGAVKLDDKLDQTFYGKTKPIMDRFEPEALAISGFSREEHLEFDDPLPVFVKFGNWVKKTNKQGTKPVFLSDNNGFDWQWINYYFHKFTGDNPFGFSSRRIGDLYCGLVKNVRANRDWKKLRISPHNHDPLSDAKGNAEALIAFSKKYGLKIPME